MAYSPNLMSVEDSFEEVISADNEIQLDVNFCNVWSFVLRIKFTNPSDSIGNDQGINQFRGEKWGRYYHGMFYFVLFLIF
jgi:hypothetical protein